MIKAILFFTLILFSQQRKFSLSCKSKACKLSKKQCYVNKPGCSFKDVALNGDFFVYKNKFAQSSNSSELAFLKTQIKDLKDNDSRMIQFFQQEIREISQSQETLKEQILETESGLRIKLKIKTSFKIIVEAKREIFWEILDGQGSLDDISTEEMLEILKFAFNDDVISLGKYLEEFRDDSLRTSVVYPDSCDGRCITAYEGMYSLWAKAIKKTFKAWNMKFKYFKNCDRKRWKMAQKFDNVISRFPGRFRRELRDYFKYMVISQICKTF